MLATLIQRYKKKKKKKKKIISFLHRVTEILQAVTFYDCINTIYQIIKTFLNNKISIFEEYGAFNSASIILRHLPD